MKIDNLIKTENLLLLLFFLPYYYTIMAQAPVSILKNTDLNFGIITVSSTSGSVVLSTSGLRTSSGGIFLPAFTGTVSAAQFIVSGEPYYTYSITLPDVFTLYESGTGPSYMTVNSLTSSPSTAGSLATGTETIFIGATLNAEASQTPGSYNSSTGLEVMVNYN